MATAQEILTSNRNVEEHIVIGADRYITVPKSLKRIAVQFDHDVETVTFDCPRYWDDLDMSTMTVYINYKLPNGDLDAYPAKNITVDGDIMHFDWTISSNVTQYKGNLTFLVCIKKTGNDGVEVNHWNSELCTDMYISEGMECEEQAQMEYSDLITQLLERMTVVEQINVQADEMREMHDEVLNETTGVRQTSANAIKGSASGDVIKIDDISPVEHNVKVKVNTGKNLFDINKLTTYLNVTNNGDGSITVKHASNSEQTLIQLAPALEVGKTYVFNAETEAADKWIYLRQSKKYISFNSPFIITYDDLDSNLCFYASYSVTNDVNATDVIYNIQIEEGDTATEYEPYIDPTTVTVTGCGKNLFDGVLIGGYISDENFNVTSARPEYYKTIKMFLLPGTYTTFFDTKVQIIRCIFDGVYSQSGGSGISEKTFTVQKAGYVGMSFRRTDEGDWDDNARVQTELGDTATEYEPYQGGSYTPNPDGTCDVKSVSPFMQIFTDTPGVTIDAEYNRDTVKAVAYNETDLYMFSVEQLQSINSQYCGGQLVIRVDTTTLNGLPAMMLSYNVYSARNSDGIITKMFDIPLDYNPIRTNTALEHLVTNTSDFKGGYCLIGDMYVDLSTYASIQIVDRKFDNVIETVVPIYYGFGYNTIGLGYKAIISFTSSDVRDAVMAEINQLRNQFTHVGFKYTPTKHKIITPKYLGE